MYRKNTMNSNENNEVEIDIGFFDWLFNTNLSWVQSRILFELYVRSLKKHRWLKTEEYGFLKHIVFLGKEREKIEFNACISTHCNIEKAFYYLERKGYITLLMPWHIMSKDSLEDSYIAQKEYEKYFVSRPCELRFVADIIPRGEYVKLNADERSGEFLARYKEENDIKNTRLSVEAICPGCGKEFIKVSNIAKEMCKECRKEQNRLRVQKCRERKKAELEELQLQEKNIAEKSH